MKEHQTRNHKRKIEKELFRIVKGSKDNDEPKREVTPISSENERE